MKIVVAFDSFKGSASAADVGKVVCKALNDTLKTCETVLHPIADGGEGMAVIELASASGLPLIEPNLRNPLKTSTYGSGIMIKNAMDYGCRQFIIGLGGSATNDGGMGLLAALGYKFMDDSGRTLEPTGINLPNVAAIDDSEVDRRLSECRFTAACDVNNPLVGPNGAAPIFGPQKGADERMVEYLDNGLAIYAQAIKRYCGMDISDMPGAGAAGGAGGGIASLLNAGLDHADRAHVPVIGIAGSIDVDNIDDSRFTALFSILQSPVQLEEAMDRTATLRNAYFTARQIAGLMKTGCGNCMSKQSKIEKC